MLLGASPYQDNKAADEPIKILETLTALLMARLSDWELAAQKKTETRRLGLGRRRVSCGCAVYIIQK